MTKNIDILIIDDDTSLSEMLALHFEDMGLIVATATGAAKAWGRLEEYTPRLILLDQHMPDTLGISLLPKLKEKLPQTPVVMITGKHDMELAIQAIKLGALDYIHKPIDTDALNATVQKALSKQQDKKGLQAAENTEDGAPNIIGTNLEMLEVVKTIAIASQSEAVVLIQGETGTGKELVAKAIHHHAERQGPFVAINCSAIVDNLLESELFGHEKGSFTGAVGTTDGKFTVANDGTIFLDEIGEMSPHLQAKLLRVLQEQTFQRVGGKETLHSNAHVIAATHRNLEEMIKEGTFREDLFYRLKVITVEIPPLRKRKEDLKLLVPHLLGRINNALGKSVKTITKSAFEKLANYTWPGNVRELENKLTRAVAICQEDALTPELLHIGDTGSETTEKETTVQPLMSLEDIEKEHIQAILQSTNGHKGKTCSILGISRPALDRKIKKYGLDVS